MPSRAPGRLASRQSVCSRSTDRWLRPCGHCGRGLTGRNLIPNIRSTATMDFGRKLREARERRGISVRQIASATKISVAALEALERNDISRLPGGLFSRAFVRSYAAEVGLDPESTVQEFIEQFPHGAVKAGHPGSDPVEDRQAIESDRQTASTLLWTVALSVPLVAFVIYLTTSGTSFLQPTPAHEAGEAAPSTAAPSTAAPSTAAPLPG